MNLSCPYDCAGWKYIHGDVFRLPRHVNLLCAILGSGVQVCTSTSLACTHMYNA